MSHVTTNESCHTNGAFTGIDLDSDTGGTIDAWALAKQQKKVRVREGENRK